MASISSSGMAAIVRTGYNVNTKMLLCTSAAYLAHGHETMARIAESQTTHEWKNKPRNQVRDRLKNKSARASANEKKIKLTN